MKGISTLSALRNVRFRRLWIARVISEFGAGATLSTVLVGLTREGHGPSLLAINGLAQAVPAVALAWIGGGLVDRGNRRNVMVISDMTRGVAVLGYVVAFPLGPAAIFAVSAVQAAIGAFFGPASSALLGSVLVREERPAAMGLLQSGSMVATVAGTGVGGVFAASASLVSFGFVLDSATFFAAAAIVMFLRVNEEERPPSGSLLAQAHEGVRFVRSEPVILVTMLAVATTMISFSVINVSFAPLLLVQLQETSSWLGPLEAVFVGTAIVVGLMTGSLSLRLTHQQMFLIALALFVIGVGGMALAPSIWALLPTQVFTGAGQALVGVAATVMWQNRTPDRLRGRVFSLAQTVQSSATILGLVLVALVAAAVSTRAVIGFAGALLALSLAISAITFRIASRVRPADSSPLTKIR